MVCPSTHTRQGLLLASLADPDPIIFFEPKRCTARPRATFRRVCTRAAGERPRGAARTQRHCAAYGPCCTKLCTPPPRQPKKASTPESSTSDPVPVDMPTILDSVKRTGRLVIVHEAPRTLGFGAELVSLSCRALLHLEAAPVRVTGFDTPFPYALEMEYMPLSHRILPPCSTLLGPERYWLRERESSDVEVRVQLPDIGEGVAEGEIVNWLVNEGDSVTENQEMVAGMTDKATSPSARPRRVRSLSVATKSATPFRSVTCWSCSRSAVMAPLHRPRPSSAAPAAAAPAAAAPGEPAASGGPRQSRHHRGQCVGDLRETLAWMSKPAPAASDYYSDSRWRPPPRASSRASWRRLEDRRAQWRPPVASRAKT